MKKSFLCFLVAGSALCLSAFGQSITGKVVSVSNSPIADATVSLRVKGLSATTNSSGQFTLNVNTGIVRNSLQAGSGLRIEKNALVVSCASSEKLRIGVFNLRGEKVSIAMDRFFGSGTQVLPFTSILPRSAGKGMLLLKIQKGSEQYCAKVTLLGAATFSGAVNTVSLSSNAGKTTRATAAVEVLTVSKANYHPRALDITAYSAQDMGDIVLSTIAEDSAAIEHKVDSMMTLMTNAQKAGQMAEPMNTAVTPAEVTQYGFGSIFNGGEIPVNPNTTANWATRLNALQDGALASTLKIPMIYGLDAVHGNGKVPGCTIFPHNIGMGCSGDTALVEQEGRITASECAAMGIHLAFAPEVSVVRDERWGRTYEGFGETPEINSRMGAAFVRGLQGDGDMSKPSAIACCMKHFVGDGGTANGKTGDVTALSEATMRALHFPPYIAGAKEKMASIMPSYSSWSRNGKTIKETIDSQAITGMLKIEQHWDGFVLSDYEAIPQAQAASGPSYSSATVATAIRAGLDMAMIPNKDSCIKYINAIQSAIPTLLPQARVDDAVRRILRVKFRMHLWDHAKSQSNLMNLIGNAEHRAVAREAVRKSLVLLKNEAVGGVKALPLKTTDKVVVVGPWANSMGAQCGGWTIGWQGDINYTPTSVGGGQTILQGLQQIGTSANVTFDEQGNSLTGADKIVVVVGENPYAEGNGDNTNPALSGCPNAALIDKCYNTGKPVIIVMISGRPLLISDKLSKCAAFVAAWIPGTEGIGIADVLYGNYNFTGKTTHTWAASLDQIPVNTGTPYSDEPHGSGTAPLFPYGYGLTY